MKIRKNDMVKVITGKDSGKKGKVLGVMPRLGLVQVEGAGVVKRAFKARPGVRQAGIVNKTMYMNIAKVMLICPRCNKPARVGYQMENDTKVRVCKSCKATIS